MKDYSINKSPSFSQLLSLAEAIKSTREKREDLVKRRYEYKVINYALSKSYFELLEFIELADGKIITKGDFKDLIEKESAIRANDLKKLIVQSILSGHFQSPAMSDFLSLFQKTDKEMVLRLNVGERLKYSDFRNLFVDIGLLEYISSIDAYKVNPSFAPSFEQAISSSRNRMLNEEQLARALADQNKIGRDAELLVIEYEKQRLQSCPELVLLIEHTAIINVSAGYDILSWDKPNENTGPIKRYIEVKAVSVQDYGFIWTRNEIEAASKLKNSYFLYLIPVVAKNQFDLERIEIISDPYSNIFLNERDWSKIENAYTIKKLT